MDKIGMRSDSTPKEHVIGAEISRLPSEVCLNPRRMNHMSFSTQLDQNKLNGSKPLKLDRLSLIRELYRSLINTGRTYAAFKENEVYPFKPVQYLFMLMNIATYKHEKSKITHFY